MPDNALEYDATWTVNKYTVTFVVDGNVYDEVTYEYGATIVVPANPTKDGYKFSSWDQSIPATVPANDVEITTTLVANTYYIVFEANGAEGAMTSLTFTYDKAQKLTLNAFTKLGYTFVGWKLVGEDELLADGKEVINLTKVDKAEVVLTAVFEANTYTVNLNEGETTKIEATYDVEFTLPTLSKVGYTFLGWSDGKTTHKGTVSNLTSDVNGKVNLTAVWQINSHKVKIGRAHV